MKHALGSSISMTTDASSKTLQSKAVLASLGSLATALLEAMPLLRPMFRLPPMHLPPMHQHIQRRPLFSPTLELEGAEGQTVRSMHRSNLATTLVWLLAKLCANKRIRALGSNT